MRIRLAAAIMVACCAAPGAAADAPRDVDWRKVATPADRARLRRWRVAWVDALAAVRAGGLGARLAADPMLFDPDRALADAALRDGRYRCRTFRLGARAPGDAAFLVQNWVDCTVSRDGEATGFATGGSQHATGHLFDGTDARTVFLGTMALGDEGRAMRYGRDPTRDMAGVVERIGARRWRMVLPYPGFGSTLDLIEIAAR